MGPVSELLTARSVAAELGVCPTTVLRWTRRGQIPAIRLPSGQLRYRRDDLEAWLAKRATPNQGVLTAVAGAAQARTLSSDALTAVPTKE
jgi:excisionase family DNA binding protein